MFKKIAETIVAGAIGMIALYTMGTIAYHAGQNVAREECRYHAMRRANERMKSVEHPDALPEETNSEKDLTVVEGGAIPLSRKKQDKLGLFFGARQLLRNRRSVIGNLIQSPEDHKFEAFVQGDELQIHVKRKEAS